MRMEIDLETMLEVALGGPEIGPLNLNVLHGLMREILQRINLSEKSMLIEDENPDFYDSFNFIKSKIDEKNKRPRTAGGGYRRVKSRVSVIVSDYVRAPIGEESEDENSVGYVSKDVEDRIRHIESELKHVKDFPTANELRSWAKENTSPDTVVTDLWHFVSLNHRMNAVEEGIQKLTALVDKLIPELKALGDEQSKMKGKVDDLYSQFKGLSDRMSYIDGKIDDARETIGEEIKDVLDFIKRIESKLEEYPRFENLEKFVTFDFYNRAEELGRATVMDIRDKLSNKLDSHQLDSFVTQDDFMNFINQFQSVEKNLADFAKIKDLENFVSKYSYNETQDNLRNMMSSLQNKLSNKAEESVMQDFVNQADLVKLSKRINELEEASGDQVKVAEEMKVTQKELKKKADNADIVDFITKDDLNRTLRKVQNQQNAINEIQLHLKTFNDEKSPLLFSKLNDVDLQISRIDNSLLTLQDEFAEKNNKDIHNAISNLKSLLNQLLDQFNEHDKTCKNNLTDVLNGIEMKLDRSEIQPLKDYLENCYETLLDKQQQSQIEEITECNRPSRQHFNSTTKGKTSGDASYSQRMPQISQSNFPRKSTYNSMSDEYICHHSHDNGAVVRAQMKFNCLSCGRPLSMQPTTQLQTLRGKPLNAYELDQLRLLQKILKGDNIEKDGRACGGKYTTSAPFKKSVRGTSSKSLPVSGNENNQEILLGGEIDIEGLDGKLYGGLMSKHDISNHTRSKSANAQIRTVSPRPKSGKDRPISGK